MKALSPKWPCTSKCLDYLGVERVCIFYGTGNKVEMCQQYITSFKLRFSHLDLYIFCILLNVAAVTYLSQSCRQRDNFFRSNIKLASALAQKD